MELSSLNIPWPVEHYTEGDVFDRALHSYCGDASWSVASFGTRKWEIPYRADNLLDGAVGWFVSAEEVIRYIATDEWSILTNALKLYGRLLLRIDDCSDDEILRIGNTLEDSKFQVIGVVRQRKSCLICAECWGGSGQENRRDFYPGYYKMSRFKIYQQMQLVLLHYDLEGLVVEAGDTNHVIHHMCNDLRITYQQVHYPEYDIQDLRCLKMGTVNVFICDNTLEHVRDPMRAVSEIHRVLRTGGVGIFMTPFIATCQPSDFFRFSRSALEIMFKRFRSAHIGFWGNCEAASCYIEHDKWVSVDYEKAGALYCHDRQDAAAASIILASSQDDSYPIHYFTIVMK